MVDGSKRADADARGAASTRGDAVAETALDGPPSDPLAATALGGPPPDAVTGGDALAATAVGGPPPDPAIRRAGDTVGRYVIERLLGSGGMGVVYAARDPDLDRTVAIKLLHDHGGRPGAETHARFLREARAMARVQHANVITVHEAATAGGVALVAMELIDGPNLAEWLRARPRPRAEVLEVFRAAGRGLAAAHAVGLVHRDFKPANVMISRGGRVVVTDFGLARAFADDEAEAAVTDAGAAARHGDVDVSSTLTRTGAMLGTPAYMAPEQFAAAATDPRTDQYAFAIALWEALTGARPFAGNSVEELRTAAGRGAIVGGERIPRRLRRVVARALAPAPAARWPDLDQLLAALDRAQRWPRRVAVWVAAAAAIGAVAAVVAVGWGRRRAAPATAACAVSDVDLEQAWSDELATQLGARFGALPAWQANRAALDDVARTWRSERAAACAAPVERAYGRIACLLAMRDELAALTSLAESIPIDVMRGVQIAEVLPDPTACRAGGMAGRPPLPADPEVRAALSQRHRESAIAVFTARAGDIDRARAVSADGLAQARARGDVLGLALALNSAAVVEHIAGDCARAGALYEEAAIAADRAQATGVRALAKLGQLECALQDGADRDDARRLILEVEAAIDGTGGDRSLRAALDVTVAAADVDAGDLDRAIERSAAGRATFLETGEHRRAAMAIGLEARARQLRAGPGDAARAVELLREMVTEAERAYGPAHPFTASAKAELAAAERAP